MNRRVVVVSSEEEEEDEGGCANPKRSNDTKLKLSKRNVASPHSQQVSPIDSFVFTDVTKCALPG